ncbi:transposase [Niallia circulans]|uniref:Transposase n=1 Tax=Niallia circulans TaxID=1397 RepID=A0A941GF87_NIACI|nr:transposase [Niallia circulans]
MIQALQGLRGIALVLATSIAAEIGAFRRFANPKGLRGLIPSESSSGDTKCLLHYHLL